MYLWYPQSSDGVLFELGARRMAAGAAFYRDLWDIKQPGIYWIYQAGLALGPGVVGPRLLEIAGVLVGGGLVWWLTRGWGLHPVVRVLAPAAVLGSALLMTHRGGVLVVEGLAGPLLVLALAASWPVDPAGGPPRRCAAWAVAGAAAGAIGVLKVLYLPLPATLLAGALLASRTTAAGRLARAAAAVAGAAVPLGATTAYFALHDALALAWTTTVVVPLESVTGGIDEGRPYRNWVELGVELSTLLVPLAVVALATARRRGTLLRELTLAAVVGEVVVLAFGQYPTPYRFLVAVAPVGLLAVTGADVVARRALAARRPRRAVALLVVAAAVLALPLARGPQRLLVAAPQVPGWGLDRAARDARDAVLDGADAGRDAAAVTALVRPGDAIYVFGPPELYERLGAREAVEVTGWAATLMPARVWRERDRELARSRPRLVYLERANEALVRARSPRFAELLDRSYRRVAAAQDGDWYLTGTPGTPSGIPGDDRMDRISPGPGA